MYNWTDDSRRFADALDPGEHRLDNHILRDVYDVGRVTAKIRAEIAAELERAGLEIISDPASEPLVVRKTRVVAARATSASKRRAWWKRPWVIALAGVVLLFVIVGAATGGKDTEAASDQTASTTKTRPAATTAAAPAEPTKTLADAQDEIDHDHYAAAVAIGAAIGHDADHNISRRVARRIGRRALYALSRGDRSRASHLLSSARQYGDVDTTRKARSTLRAAQRRAAEQRAARARARAEAKARRKAEQAAKRAAERAAATPDPPSSSPSLSGPSSVNWCGKRDGDGDGIYCE